MSNVSHIIWQGSFYSFRRIMERLDAMKTLYERTRFTVQSVDTDLSERDEIIIAMMRNPVGDSTVFATLLSRIVGLDSQGAVTLDPRAVAVMSIGTFHYESTLTVAESGKHLLFKQREPYRPQAPLTLNG